MSLKRLNPVLIKEIEELRDEGRAKAPERVITEYIPAEGNRGPRYKLRGAEQEFLRMNSNSYLSLSNHPEVMEAADRATARFGVGPGAVRFIDGTFEHHVALEQRIAEFTEMPAAKIFNSAYTANLALALTIGTKETYWAGDQLNHNSIIRAMRIAGVPSGNKAIYKHNDVNHLQELLENTPPSMNRGIVIFDGIFSMRGDVAPMDEIVSLCSRLDAKFKEGLVTVVDDSHGIGAFGKRGRGTPDFCGVNPDIIVGTFGKAFGVNGGFIAGSPELVEAVRQKGIRISIRTPSAWLTVQPLPRPWTLPTARKGWRDFPPSKPGPGSSERVLNNWEWSPFPGPTRWYRCWSETRPKPEPQCRISLSWVS